MSSNVKKCIVFGPEKRLCVSGELSVCFGLIKLPDSPIMRELVEAFRRHETADYNVPLDKFPDVADFLDRLRECAVSRVPSEVPFEWPDWLEAMVPARRKNMRKIEGQMTVEAIEEWLREKQITVADAERKMRENVYQSRAFQHLPSDRKEAILRAIMGAMAAGLGAAAVYEASRRRTSPGHSGIGIPGTRMR